MLLLPVSLILSEIAAMICSAKERTCSELSRFSVKSPGEGDDIIISSEQQELEEEWESRR
jgi:hypothetical protein